MFIIVSECLKTLDNSLLFLLSSQSKQTKMYPPSRYYAMMYPPNIGLCNDVSAYPVITPQSGQPCAVPWGVQVPSAMDPVLLEL